MNKTALITGSSRGIGKACAIELASRGFNIIINYLNSEKEANELKYYLAKTYDVKVITIKADISNELNIKNMKEVILKEFKCIDVLINNASIAIDTTYEDKTKENFMKILEVNLVGTFLVTKYIGEEMLKNKSGKIINISSNNAINSNYVESLDYDASKAGVISLTHNMAKYYAPYITVNAIAPGWVNTDMNKNLDKEFIDEENKKILLGRFANAKEIAKLVGFLSSEDSDYINDEIIRIDGGINE